MKIKQILIDTNTGEDVHHRSLGSLHLSWSQLSTALNTAVKSGSNIGVQWWRNWGRGPPDLIPSTAPACSHLHAAASPPSLQPRCRSQQQARATIAVLPMQRPDRWRLGRGWPANPRGGGARLAMRRGERGDRSAWMRRRLRWRTRR
jgi:hypothetical protein